MVRSNDTRHSRSHRSHTTSPPSPVLQSVAGAVLLAAEHTQLGVRLPGRVAPLVHLTPEAAVAEEEAQTQLL